VLFSESSVFCQGFIVSLGGACIIDKNRTSKDAPTQIAFSGVSGLQAIENIPADTANMTMNAAYSHQFKLGSGSPANTNFAKRKSSGVTDPNTAHQNRRFVATDLALEQR
jgi:hypothetical protein